ncbi:MAG: CBU_0585 family protein [Legionellaceae bacterium]|nr:CBU_0585 family protein [Legionellaceae bacterium]
MSSHEVNKAFISPIDIFLRQWDKHHEKTPSQCAEIEKHAKIAKRRDQRCVDGEEEGIWEGF